MLSMNYVYLYKEIYIFIATYTHTHIVGGLKYKLNLLYILCPVGRALHGHEYTVGQNSAHN